MPTAAPFVQSNPFRSSASSVTPTIDEPSNTSEGLTNSTVSPQSTDELTREINSSIAQVSADVAPRVDAS